MRLAPCSVTRIGASIAILGAVALGCASESTTGLAVPDAMYAKGGGSGPTIKSTNPSRGEPGTTLDVRIFGSGFEVAARARAPAGRVAASARPATRRGVRARILPEPSEARAPR